VASLEAIVADVMGVPSEAVTEDFGPVTTAQWTSLRHVQLVSAVQREYDVRLAPREIRSVRSVGDLRAVLRDKGVTA
jgi:acyl carrier protein